MEDGGESLRQFCEACEVKGPQAVLSHFEEREIYCLEDLRKEEDEELHKSLRYNRDLERGDAKKVMSGLERLRKPKEDKTCGVPSMLKAQQAAVEVADSAAVDKPRKIIEDILQRHHFDYLDTVTIIREEEAIECKRRLEDCLKSWLLERAEQRGAGPHAARTCIADLREPEELDSLRQKVKRLREESATLARQNHHLLQQGQEKDQVHQEEMEKMHEEQRRFLLEIHSQRQRLEDAARQLEEKSQENHQIQEDLLGCQQELKRKEMSRMAQQEMPAASWSDPHLKKDLPDERRKEGCECRKLQEMLAKKEQCIVELEERLSNARVELQTWQREADRGATQRVPFKAEGEECKEFKSQPQGSALQPHATSIRPRNPISHGAEHVKVGSKITLPAEGDPRLRYMRIEWSPQMRKHCGRVGVVKNHWRDSVEVTVDNDTWFWDLEVIPSGAVRYCFEGCPLQDFQVCGRKSKCSVCKVDLLRGFGALRCKSHEYTVCKYCQGVTTVPEVGSKVVRGPSFKALHGESVEVKEEDQGICIRQPVDGEVKVRWERTGSESHHRVGKHYQDVWPASG
ncbi:unnamed protein product [Durusdinium trenchii]|uniref:Reticulocyte-binding protein 2 homolog a n=2 Tax=Durusdinium trenchii TaxID=1381693 RepID=A0ABP0LFG3_9DINO